MRLPVVPLALSLAIVSCGPSDASARTNAPSDAPRGSASAIATTSSTTGEVAKILRSPGNSKDSADSTEPEKHPTDGQAADIAGASAASTGSAVSVDTAIFAGGCFWCMEPPYDKLDGVLSTTSGYTAGSVANPTYEQVSAGGTGHTEAVQVVFDPVRITYDRLLRVFWRNIDPFARNQQFCDRGSQYRSGIYPRNSSQKAAAEASLREVAARFSRPIATEILAATPFYAAEDYHQNYYTKNPLRYKFYRATCGRDGRLEEIWGNEAGA